jgi:hypothetical protein
MMAKPIDSRSGGSLIHGEIRKINHEGAKITKKHEGMQGKRRAENQAMRLALPDHFLPSLPWCVFVPFAPWWLIFLPAPAGR